MKQIVQTTGSFILMDPYTNDEISASRPSVVGVSPFIEARAAARQLKILKSDLPERASDEEFAEYWAEGPEMAVDAFASSFEGDAEFDEFKEVIIALGDEDFQKDGKPKVGPLKEKLTFEIDTAKRDDLWARYEG